MPHRAWRFVGSSAGRAEDSEEGRSALQQRIALFGQVGSLFVIASYVLVNLGTAARFRPPWGNWLSLDSRLHLASGSVLVAVWLLCRGRPLTLRTLRTVDAGGTFLACLGAALPLWLVSAAADYKYRTLLAVTNALIARAAVVPSAGLRTLWISALSALPAFLFCSAFAGPAGPQADPVAGMLSQMAGWWLLLAAAIATGTSQAIYGLRLKVREARQLGQYTLLEKLGQGGMGEVYRAQHAMLRRPTAVKLLLPGAAGDTSRLRFEREVQLTAILTHPNTVSVFDYGHTSDGIFYYAMEYLEGLSLDDLVLMDGPQPPARVAHIVRQVCGSLAEAHGIGLIHRDIKPANVILCERGGVPDVAKVFDFGLVRDMQDHQNAALTSDNAITGTPLFLAPEALTAPESVDARSDLYALGGVAYYLLTGKNVFEGRNLVEVCGHHLHTQPVPPSRRLGRTLPARLEEVVLSCLEKDPAQRPQSARALQEMLADCPEVGEWSEAEARRWWQEKGGRVFPSRAAGPPATSSVAEMTLTVDLKKRAAGFAPEARP